MTELMQAPSCDQTEIYGDMTSIVLPPSDQAVIEQNEHAITKAKKCILNSFL